MTTPNKPHADSKNTLYCSMTEALVQKGFLFDLVGAFDTVSEFGPILGPELATYLRRPEADLAADWWKCVLRVGADLEEGWAEEIVSEVQRLNLGLRGLGPALGALTAQLDAARLDAAEGGTGEPAPRITRRWICETLS